MKISVTDTGSGITREFARAIGATIRGRFIDIPASKGSGYITGFSWGKDLRMMIRNYHLKEEVRIQRTNEFAEGQEDMVFLLSGIFPSLAHSTPGSSPEQSSSLSQSSSPQQSSSLATLSAESLPQPSSLSPEQPNILICRHAVSSVMLMPSNTMFESITIAVSKQHLHQLFGHITHPVVTSVLTAKDNFVFETEITQQMIAIAGEMLDRPVPENLESQYYKLKCEELLCYIFAVLMQREEVPAGNMHIEDIRAIYRVKAHLQSQLDQPPNIASLAKEAGMSEPKLRKRFKQIFGKGIFEYYQFGRMQAAAKLLKEGRLTVSETGYQLGFTNLSHFSRVFEAHFGIKPKKYSQTN